MLIEQEYGLHFIINLYNSLDDISSFQSGVDTIYNGCKTYGSTTTAKTPAAIVNSIKTIYNNRYNAGVTAGSSSVKKTLQFTLQTNLDGYVYHGSKWYSGTKVNSATIKIVMNADNTYTISATSVNIGGFDSGQDFQVSGHAYIKNISVS